MRKFVHNIRDVLVFSDSELLELVLCLVLIIVNPTHYAELCVPHGWCALGVVAALSILWGLGRRNIRARETGLLLALVNLTALNFIEFRHYHIDAGHLLQNFVIGYIWWKVGRQRMIREIRGRCNRGTK